MKYKMDDLQDLAYEDTYIDIHLTVTVIDTDPTVMAVDYIENIVWRLEFKYFPYNEAPSYDADPTPIGVRIGAKAQFSTGAASADTTKAEFELLESDESRVALFNEMAEVKIDESTWAVMISVAPTKMEQMNTYDLKITLHDEDDPEPLTKEYTFFVVVRGNADPLLSDGTNSSSNSSSTSSDVAEFTMTIKSIASDGTIELEFNKDLNASSLWRFVNMPFD